MYDFFRTKPPNTQYFVLFNTLSISETLDSPLSIHGVIDIPKWLYFSFFAELDIIHIASKCQHDHQLQAKIPVIQDGCHQHGAAFVNTKLSQETFLWDLLLYRQYASSTQMYHLLYTMNIFMDNHLNF